MKPRFDLLRQLAAHIVSDKRGHENFDYGVYNSFLSDDMPTIRTGNKCGTNGCAIGELPILFPKDFVFNGTDIRDKKIFSKSTRAAAILFFGICNLTYEYLFIPSNYAGSDLNPLSDQASAEEVSQHIIDWCDREEPKHA